MLLSSRGRERKRISRVLCFVADCDLYVFAYDAVKCVGSSLHFKNHSVPRSYARHPRNLSTFKPSPIPLLLSQQELRARNPDLSMSLSKLGGSIGGGVVAASLSHPMDTIKVLIRVHAWVREECFGYL